MFSTCSPTLPEQDFMWDIRLATLQVTYMHATSDSRDSMCLTQWDMMHMVFLQNNMQYRPDSIRKLLQWPISTTTESSWTR